MTISVFQRIWHRFVTPFAETEPFASPFQDYAPNVSDSDSAPVVSLAVKSLASSFRPVCPSQHGSPRHHRQARQFPLVAKTYRIALPLVETTPRNPARLGSPGGAPLVVSPAAAPFRFLP